MSFFVPSGTKIPGSQELQSLSITRNALFEVLIVENLKTNNINMQGGKITNLAEPIDDSDAATKDYVDTREMTLTGPISATAGVTSVTSQTGNGSTFVMNTSPILITPDIGVASGTSLGIAGNVSAGGTCSAIDFVSTSDRRLKSNIKNIDHNDIIKFLKIKGYTYNLNNESCTRYGVIAQDLEEVGLGSLVDDSSDHKKVSYQSLIPIMIETIKNMEYKIEKDLVKITLLEKRIEKLEKKSEEL